MPDEIKPDESSPAVKLLKLREAVRGTFTAIGSRGNCRSCHAPIFWVRTKTGRQMPIDAEKFVSHFTTCPQADLWRSGD